MSLAFDLNAFLVSESTWTTRLGPGWVGTKLLGEGVFGAACLFQYIPPPTSTSPPPEITQLVVKLIHQDGSSYSPPDGTSSNEETEEEIMRTLSATGSLHIVRLYKSSRTVAGQTLLIMEFCEGGDMARFIRRAETAQPGYLRPKAGSVPDVPMAERKLWSIFCCLVRGIRVLDSGREQGGSIPGWQGAEMKGWEICHYDLKPENILLGTRDTTTQHTSFPICKIADLGEALFVPALHLQTNVVGSERGSQGDGSWSAPEECVLDYGQPLSSPRKGTVSNIFQIGCIMFALIFQNKRFFPKPPDVRQGVRGRSELSDRLRGGVNHGWELDQDGIAAVYSKSLRGLVMECMMREPLGRVGIEELFRRTEEGLSDAVVASEGLGGDSTSDLLASVEKPEP